MKGRVKEGDLNELLMKQGARIFKKLEGYGTVKWARRIGASGKEIDFVLINPTKERVGVVECALSLSGDVAQLRQYAGWLKSKSPEEISASIASSTTGKPKLGVHDRKRANLASPLRGQHPEVVAKSLTGVIGVAKSCGRLDAILLVYLQRRESSRSSLRRLLEGALPKSFGNRKDGIRWRLVVVEVT